MQLLQMQYLPHITSTCTNSIPLLVFCQYRIFSYLPSSLCHCSCFFCSQHKQMYAHANTPTTTRKLPITLPPPLPYSTLAVHRVWLGNISQCLFCMRDSTRTKCHTGLPVSGAFDTQAHHHTDKAQACTGCLGLA